jgi:hypothetical protein
VQKDTEKVNDPSYRFQQKRMILKTEGEAVKTPFATTDTVRLDVNTIERLKSTTGLCQSWTDVINLLLDSYHNSK